jgi:hypothetical protein
MVSGSEQGRNTGRNVPKEEHNHASEEKGKKESQEALTERELAFEGPMKRVERVSDSGGPF